MYFIKLSYSVHLLSNSFIYLIFSAIFISLSILNYLLYVIVSIGYVVCLIVIVFIALDWILLFRSVGMICGCGVRFGYGVDVCSLCFIVLGLLSSMSLLIGFSGVFTYHVVNLHYITSTQLSISPTPNYQFFNHVHYTNYLSPILIYQVNPLTQY